MKQLVSLRISLHQQIIRRMTRLGLCTSSYLVEAFKRWYLWSHFKVETSRALSGAKLEEAKTRLNKITKNVAIAGIKKRYPQLDSDRQVLRCTESQVAKIKAVGIYKLKITDKDLKRYIEKTIDRKVFLYDLTIAEAHHSIERLEKWEVKNYKKSREKSGNR